MKTRKALAILLTLALLVGLCPIAGLLPQAAEAKPARIIYVRSTSVTDGNDGRTAEQPVSIEKALTMLNGTVGGTIRLVEDTTLAYGSIGKITTGAITITTAPDNDKATLTFTNAITFSNDMVLDNIIANFAGAVTVSEATLTTTDCFETAGTAQSIYMCTKATVAGEKHGRSRLVLDSCTARSNTFANICLYGGSGGESLSLAGADIELGNIKINCIATGGPADGKFTTYTADINIRVSAGTVFGANMQIFGTENKHGKFADGAKLHFYYPQGMDDEATKFFKFYPLLAAESAEYIKNVHAAAYFIEYAAEVTDIAYDAANAAYAVAPAEEAWQATASNGTVTNAVRGLLPLPAAGRYTVAKATEPAESEGAVVYITHNGAGKKDGSSADDAYSDDTAGWQKACTDTTPINNTITIKLVGENVYLPNVSSDNKGHLKAKDANTRLIVKAASANTRVILSGRCNVRGNVTLDTMTLTLAGKRAEAYFDTYSTTTVPVTLTFGKDFSCSGLLLEDDPGSNNVNEAIKSSLDAMPTLLFGMNGSGSSTQPVAINIHGGTFREIIFGSKTSGNFKLPKTTLTVDGEAVEIGAIQLGSRTSATTTYTGDVTIILKNGKVSGHNGADRYICGANSNGKSTYNNGAVVRVLQSTAMKTIPESAAPKNSYLGSIDTETDIPFYKLIVPAEQMAAITAQETRATFNYTAPYRSLTATQCYTDKGVAVSGDVAVVDSENGVLSLATAIGGIYKLAPEWVSEDNDVTAYVDSVYGDDLFGDGTKLRPYRTLSTALAYAGAHTGAVISVVDKAELISDIPETANGITIVGTGTDNKTPVNLGKAVGVHGDLKLDNMKLTVTATKNAANNSWSHQCGFILHGVKFTTGEGFASGYAATQEGEAQSMSASPELRFDAMAATPSTATINNGNIGLVFFASDYTTDGTTNAPGGTLILRNNAQVNQLYLNSNRGTGVNYTEGTTLKRDIQYVGNINIIATDSSYCVTKSFQAMPSNENKNSREITFADDCGIQVVDYSTRDIITNVENYPAYVLTVEPTLAQTMREQLAAGYELTPQDTAGTFAIGGGMPVQVEDSTLTDGRIKLAKGTLTVDKGVTPVKYVRFADLPVANDLTKVFLGWKNKSGMYVTAESLTDTAVLTPDYTTLTQTPSFVHPEVQIREDDTNADGTPDAYSMRCIVKMSKAYWTQLTAVDGISEVSRGTLLIPEMALGDKELTATQAYSFKDKTYYASAIEAKKLMVQYPNLIGDTDNTYYNVTLTNLYPHNYKMTYAYRGYITYVDASGVRRVLYASADDGHTPKSVYGTAKAIAEEANEAVDATELLESVTAEANKAGDPRYIYRYDETAAENPVSLYFNPAAMYTSRSSALTDEKAAQKTTAVLNADASVEPATEGKKTYYIAMDAVGSADGTSAEQPWSLAQLYAALNDEAITADDVILFRRGDLFRGVSLTLPVGVSVGAYGTGAKPILVGSDKNYAELNDEGKSYWLASDKANIWKLDLTENVMLNMTDTGPSRADIGNIVFDHGKTVASAGKKRLLDAMTSNYDFYYDDGTKCLYLYLSTGNPAEQHCSIELSPNKPILRYNATAATNESTMVVDNLTLKYTGGHGISVAGVRAVTVKNCEIGYIGGAMTGNNGRYGNGVEFFNGTDSCFATDNWIYQCFDAGYTNQSQAGTQHSITVSGNLIEYCLYNMELWTPANDANQPMKNCTYENNILRFAGYGFGTFGRKDFNTSAVWASNISMNTCQTVCENVMIKNNILDYTYRYLVVAGANTAGGLMFEGNVWSQRTDEGRLTQEYSGSSDMAVAGVAMDGQSGARYYCPDGQTMKDSVTVYDGSATVYLDGKAVS